MNVDKFLDILNYIICTILVVSIFLIWIPIDDGGTLGLIIACIQVFVVFYLHNALKSKKTYYFFTSLLAISNIVNCFIYYIYTKNSIEGVDSTTTTGNLFDSFIVSLIPALLELFFIGILIITAIVIIECIVSMILKNRYFKKAQTSSECTDI